jgi:hypothetical protein
MLPIFRWFFEECSPLNVRILQALAFACAFWFFSAQDFDIYAYFPADQFRYYRWFTSDGWTYPLQHFLGGLFIYDLGVPVSAKLLIVVQTVVCAAAVAGFFGLAPRFAAAVVFFGGLHLMGIYWWTNQAMDSGATILLGAMLIFMFTERNTLYNGFDRYASDTPYASKYGWPVKLFWLQISFYYFCSGLNKLLFIGFDWPYVLNLHFWSDYQLQALLFPFSRDVTPLFQHIISHKAISVAFGVFVLVFELMFILFIPIKILRIPLLLAAASFHIGVYFHHGFGYHQNAIILMGAVDWEGLLKRFQPRVPHLPAISRG